jgi:hypothetical protein
MTDRGQRVVTKIAAGGQRWPSPKFSSTSVNADSSIISDSYNEISFFKEDNMQNKAVEPVKSLESRDPMALDLD